MSQETSGSSGNRARYEFKRALEDLEGVRGRGTELISLYIPPDKMLHDVVAQLRDEYGQAQNIKSKRTRKNVGAALESIMQRLKQFKEVPENGLVFLVGHKAAGGDQTKMVQHVLLPPEPVDLYIYRCDSEFYLEPLERQLKEKENYGLVVIDRSEASVGFLRGNHVEAVYNTTSNVPSKHGRGGQSHRRFERLIEESAYNFFKKVGEKANEVFLAEEDLKGILVGGPGATKETWLEQGHLHHELEKKVVETFDTGYTDESGLRELVQNAQQTLRERGLMEEKDLVQRFLREVGKPDGGDAAYGEDFVRHAIQIGAVDTLLLSEKLRKLRADVRCTSCDHAREETTRTIEELEEALAACPDCGGELEVGDTVDIVEELAEMTENMGGGVEMITADSEEGQLLWNAFGGVAALLRFHVEPPSAAQMEA